MTDYDDLEQALRESRSKTNMHHGHGAWDVADVMSIVKPFVERALQAHIRQENTASGQPKWRTDNRCVYCDGTGHQGGRTYRYGDPEVPPRCNVCNGSGLASNGYSLPEPHVE